MMDPLECSGDAEEIIETKVMLADDKVGQIESDDEQNMVEHLSPQTLLETPTDGEVQYSVRSPEGAMITYRVLQVEESNGDTAPQMVSTSGNTFTTASTVPQVLTSNINGQLYIVGNANEVFATQGGSRAIAPRTNVIENNTVVHHIRKRDERRRATHNEVERRRRDKINNWITKLAAIIPDSPNDLKGNGQYDGHSKGGILAKACDYIVQLQQNESKVEDVVKENKFLEAKVEFLKQRNQILERENKEFREILKRSGLEVSSDPAS